MGDTVRRNAGWLKTLVDWKHRDVVRPFTLRPYPQAPALQIVIGEKHDDRGRRIPDPSWFSLEGGAIYTGILVVGDTGSGKTTCAGFPWLEKMIQSGLGGFVLDAGGAYVRFVQRQMKAAGREQDLIVIEPGGQAKYNPMAKPDMRSADLAGWIFQVIVTGHGVFLRRSRGSSRRDLSNCSASEVHRDVNERDRILTRVGTGSIPERGKAIRTPGKSGRARV
jgi:hypothetical protein